MTNSKKTTNTITNQNEAVIKFLRRNYRSKFTSEQICVSINQHYNLKGKNALTTTQISKCLNRFSEKNMVKIVDINGVHSSGRKVGRWAYIKA